MELTSKPVHFPPVHYSAKAYNLKINSYTDNRSITYDLTSIKNTSFYVPHTSYPSKYCL